MRSTFKCSKWAKASCIDAYNLIGILTALYLLVRLAPEVLFSSDPLVSSYALKNSNERFVFRMAELLFLFEALFHVLRWREMKRHMLLFGFWAAFLAFGVIPFYMSHYLVIYWVYIRSLRKLLRYCNRIY